MDSSLLLLSPDRQAQLTKALSNLGVADPLQTMCDEAAADVARLTAGYVLDPLSLQQMTRSLALYRAYAKAGPVPKDVKTDFDAAMKELEAIAEGKRPNLPKVAVIPSAPNAGAWGSGRRIRGRIGSQSPRDRTGQTW